MVNHSLVVRSLLAFSLAIPSITQAIPLPLDIRAGQSVARHFPTGAALVDNLAPFCKSRSLEGDLCSMGYATEIIQNAMSKEGYSAKDTIAKIGNAGYSGITMYENARLEEITGPLIGMFGIPGGNEYMIQYGLATKQDVERFKVLFDKDNQSAQLKANGVHKMKAVDKSCVQKMLTHFKKEAGEQGKYMSDDIFSVQAENWCMKNG